MNVCWLNNFRLKDLSVVFHFNSPPYFPVSAEQGKGTRDTEEGAQARGSGRPDKPLSIST